MKEKQHLDVREIGNALKRFRRELLGESDASFFPAPKIVFRMRANGLDKADGLDLLDHSNRIKDLYRKNDQDLSRYFD